MILVLGKAKSHRVPNLGCSGAESPRWFDVSTKNSAWNIMHEWACCHEEAANHQLPTASAFWIIWIVSVEECSSLKQNLMQIQFALLTHFECDGHTVHMLTQLCLPPPPLTSTVKSPLFMHTHSSPLSRLHQCGEDCSHYVNDGWAFSRQTSYVSHLLHPFTYGRTPRFLPYLGYY